MRIDDLDAHEKAFGFPPKHPTMKTMLGVAIWAEGEVRESGYRFAILRPSFPFRARYRRREDIVRKIISGLTAGGLKG